MTTSKFIRWWNDNRDSVNERRRRRYANDVEFRRRERQRQRERRSGSKRDGSRLPKPRPYHHKGQVVIIWSVGVTAKYLGVSTRTIANLESKETIPTNRIIDENGRRWWPKDYVEWLKPYFDLKKSGKITSQEFSRRVWKDWQDAADATFPVFSEVTDDQDSGPRSDSRSSDHCSS